ncbi:hypothetical protein AOXY_G23276 [Acipenser oxyrinchus oxyrinchus]|uniref:Secreted protein n=1 Tax=Acipenser oxyrinchus oxyrinchus TaxID=40147 RepID=A0AAD8CV10_ACIOX|nr:hypothetical protein AOXY_G23276 [Acipenser oxyrinchus oxyrinchus]
MKCWAAVWKAVGFSSSLVGALGCSVQQHSLPSTGYLYQVWAPLFRILFWIKSTRIPQPSPWVSCSDTRKRRHRRNQEETFGNVINLALMQRCPITVLEW